MDEHGFVQCRPRLRDPEVQPEPFLDLQSGYIQRAIEQFPKQGSKTPWKLYQNYARDLVSLGHGRVDDGTLEFSGPSTGASAIETGAESGAVSGIEAPTRSATG